MRANRALRLILTRGGRAPALLADPTRPDQIEIVEIDSGEVALFWDCTPREASRRAAPLREDLNRMDLEEFLERWRDEDASRRLLSRWVAGRVGPISARRYRGRR